jgi:hypothetical protein
MAEVLFQQGVWTVYADAGTRKPYFYNEDTNVSQSMSFADEKPPQC